MADELTKYPALMVGQSRLERIPSGEAAIIKYRFTQGFYGLRINRYEVILPDGRLVEWLEGQPPPGIDGPSPV